MPCQRDLQSPSCARNVRLMRTYRASNNNSSYV